MYFCLFSFTQYIYCERYHAVYSNTSFDKESRLEYTTIVYCPVDGYFDFFCSWLLQMKLLWTFVHKSWKEYTLQLD